MSLLLGGLLLSSAPGRAQAGPTELVCGPEDETILDTLGEASAEDAFSFFGSSGPLIGTAQEGPWTLAVGPRFTLTKPMIITELGAFVNNCLEVTGGTAECDAPPPVSVSIHRANGDYPAPEASAPALALSDDADPLSYAYESTHGEIRLEPGSYFALFALPLGAAGNLLANASEPYSYQAEEADVGFLQSEATPLPLWSATPIAVRIVGQAVESADPRELVSSLREQTGALDRRIATPLRFQLRRVEHALARARPSQACDNLRAYRQLVRAWSGVFIPRSIADAWLCDVERITRLISC